MSNEGTVVRVDPATLIVAANVRSNTKVTKEHVASVKLHGVLVPITAQEAEDGLRVVDGQRRTLAAVEAGLQDVPVFVVAPLEDAARIVDQVVVNEHRAELDDVEQVLAMKELEQLGVSAAATAKRTGAARKVVESALTVGSSTAATSAMREQQLSFSAAIAVAGFDDDPEAQARVLRANGSSYVVEQERSARARVKMTAELEAQGVVVIDPPAYDAVDVVRTSDLYTGPKLSTTAASLSHDELVKRAGDGLRAYIAFGYNPGERVPEVHYAVAGWRERGFFVDAWREKQVPTADLSPEEQAAKKEQRRKDRERTKAWDIATGVRVAWLQKRGKPAPGWELLSAQQSLDESYGNYPWPMVLTLLQAPESAGGLGKYDVVKYLDEHPTRAPQVALALALGSIEGARHFDRKGIVGAGIPRAAGVVGLRTLRRRARGSGCRSGAVNQLRRHQARFRRESTSQRVSKPMTVPTAAPMSVTDASAPMEAWAASSFVIRSSGAPHRRSAAMSLLASIKRTTRLDGYASEPRCSIIASAWRLTLSIAARTASILRVSSRSSAPRRSTRSVAATPTMVPEIPAAYVAQSLTGFTVSGVCLV